MYSKETQVSIIDDDNFYERPKYNSATRPGTVPGG
jgi:hypothetical protein